jgi:hypothetical protein
MLLLTFMHQIWEAHNDRKTAIHLYCQGPSGTILEVNERKEIVWKYISPEPITVLSGRAKVLEAGLVWRLTSVFAHGALFSRL